MQVPPTTELASFYRHHLEHVVLPFWLDAPVDRQHGGVFNCLDDVTGARISEDKFVWSQGRWGWTMAHAARMAERGALALDANELLGYARQTADFLIEHAFLRDGEVHDGGPADGATAWLLDADGQRKELNPGQGHDLSFYGDGFVILALAGTARAARDERLLQRALDTYDGLRRRLAARRVRSEPYPLPAGCRAHGWPMIMLNVAQELALALHAAGHERAFSLDRDALACMDEVLGRFVRPDGLVREVVCEGRATRAGLLTEHVTPGHALESMWFVLEEALRHGRDDAAQTALRVIAASFEDGWDPQHGGLFRYRVPGQPAPSGSAEGPFEQLILDTWSTKIWWVHSEALYAMRLAAAVAPSLKMDAAPFEAMHARTFAYTLATFPNPDRSLGEWIHVRDRRGVPVRKVVGLPVKDPYHLTRNLMFLVELMAEGLTRRGRDA